MDDVKYVDTFYVRLQGKVVYFTETAKDTLVLAAIHFTQVKDSSDLLVPGCFSVSNSMDTWTMCANDQDTANTWICASKKALGQTCETTDGVNVVQTEKVVQPIIIVPLPSPNCATDWNYNSHGSDWKCRCNEGREQSPIDLDIGP